MHSGDEISQEFGLMRFTVFSWYTLIWKIGQGTIFFIAFIFQKTVWKAAPAALRQAPPLGRRKGTTRVALLVACKPSATSRVGFPSRSWYDWKQRGGGASGESGGGRLMGGWWWVGDRRRRISQEWGHTNSSTWCWWKTSTHNHHASALCGLPHLNPLAGPIFHLNDADTDATGICEGLWGPRSFFFLLPFLPFYLLTGKHILRSPQRF